jgi:hypothetical protein
MGNRQTKFRGVVAVKTRGLIKQEIRRTHNMDYTTVILGTLALAALVGLAFMSGWELGSASGIDRERQSSNRRVNGVLASVKDVIAYENTRKPKAAKNKRKATRKAVRA